VTLERQRIDDQRHSVIIEFMDSNNHVSAVPFFFTPSEVARIYKVTPATILNWERQGLIPSIRFGRVVRFELEKVRDVIEKRQESRER
jgi:excisionase family DNA binding protein